MYWASGRLPTNLTNLDGTRGMINFEQHHIAIHALDSMRPPHVDGKLKVDEMDYPSIARREHSDMCLGGLRTHMTS
jgi:hypothetical protein